MKALSASVVALVLAAMPIVCSPASNDKLLQNQSGQVTYGPSKTATTKVVAAKGSAVLNDSDWAATGPNGSKATITLPDSSVVTMGEGSQVQMQSFDNVSNKANFYVVGKVRFDVKHPAGAAANYTFQTATGQIAVRGTIGDIAALTNSSGASVGLQVNVYSLGAANLPVQVTLVNGQVFAVAAGQSLVVTTAATGALVSSVGAVSNTTFAPFSQLGAPANAGSLGITTTTTAATGAATGATTAAATTATTTAVAAGAVGVAAATTVITQTKPTDAPTPTPTPSPSPSSTTVPIVIQGQPKPAAPSVVPQPPTTLPHNPRVRATPLP